jgi:hypothetical protein
MTLMGEVSQRPALLHTLLFTSMIRDRMNRGLNEPSSIELNVGAHAVQCLNQTLSSPERDGISDYVIWATLGLAYHGRAKPLRSPDVFPRQSFLKELQDIHFYLRMELVVEHIVGLVAMIESLGGLHKIDIPGIAPTICLWVLQNPASKMNFAD